MDISEKISYLENKIVPRLKEIKVEDFSKSPKSVTKTNEDYVRHIRELHVDVALRRAEDAAGNGDLNLALRNIESAIGYLTTLHYRVYMGIDPGIEG